MPDHVDTVDGNVQFAQCHSCREQIVKGARVCTHCGSYQKYPRRFFDVGTVTLSLIVALISVSGTLYVTLFPDWLKRPSISCGVLKLTDSSIKLALLNKGNIAAMLKGGKLISDKRGIKTENQVVCTSFGGNGEENVVLEPGKIQVVELKNKIDTGMYELKLDDDARNTIEIYYLSFGMNRQDAIIIPDQELKREKPVR